MRVRFIAAFAGGLLFCTHSATADHRWASYHWEKTSDSELVLALGDNVTSDAWQAALGVSSVDWSTSAVINAPIRSGAAKNVKRCSPRGGAIEVCNGAYGNNGWLGVASISISGGHITSGSARLNDTYYNTTKYNTVEWRNSVMCQEIGHLWGLGHNDEDFSTTNGTCMDYSNNPGPNQHPDSHDYAMLEQIYSHVHPTDGGDGGGSCNPRSPKCNNNRGGDVAARVLAELSLDGPRQWGRRVSGHGPVETFELDLGANHKIITIVRWTEERANGAHDDH